MSAQNFSSKLLNWYKFSKRDLPWRDVSDPYKIWLSEIILQQTRVNQGMPYYYKFVELFPTVTDLANAQETEILRVWQGLGYYSRARNLHKCAKIIVKEYLGIFPNTYKQLLDLPGIGPYTAAAIASFAFGEQVAVVDGNVYRLLSRVYGIEADIASGRGQKIFQEKANQLIPITNPGSFNQAIMEFGALHCTPKNPECNDCIFSIECEARKQGRQMELPVKIKKVKVKKRYFNYIVLRHDEEIAMQERGAKDIWHGLYDFMLVEKEELLSEEQVMESESLYPLNSWVESVEESRSYKHILTHQHIYARFFLVDLNKEYNKPEGITYYTHEQILALPKPVLISTYLNEMIFSD